MLRQRLHCMATTRSEQELIMTVCRDGTPWMENPDASISKPIVLNNQCTVKAEDDRRCADHIGYSQPSGADEAKPTNADACRRRRRRPAGGGAVGMSQHGRQCSIRWSIVHARQSNTCSGRQDIVWRRRSQNRSFTEGKQMSTLKRLV